VDYCQQDQHSTQYKRVTKPNLEYFIRIHIGLRDYNYETRTLGAKTKKVTFRGRYETDKQGTRVCVSPNIASSCCPKEILSSLGHYHVKIGWSCTIGVICHLSFMSVVLVDCVKHLRCGHVSRAIVYKRHESGC
jgi:hypothetical protein